MLEKETNTITFDDLGSFFYPAFTRDIKTAIEEYKKFYADNGCTIDKLEDLALELYFYNQKYNTFYRKWLSDLASREQDAAAEFIAFFQDNFSKIRDLDELIESVGASSPIQKKTVTLHLPTWIWIKMNGQNIHLATQNVMRFLEECKKEDILGRQLYTIQNALNAEKEKIETLPWYQRFKAKRRIKQRKSSYYDRYY